jgi:hypothetical protein
VLDHHYYDSYPDGWIGLRYIIHSAPVPVDRVRVRQTLQGDGIAGFSGGVYDRLPRNTSDGWPTAKLV